MSTLDLRGLNPAPVTPFTADGDVDHAAMAGLGKWLAGHDGVKSLVVLGHAGEGTFLTQDEQVALIRNLVNEVSVPIIAGITGEGTKVAVEEAQRAVDSGAAAGLVYPSHGWLRFGYQQGAPQDRYRAIYEETGLPLILFQYPDNTKANYNLDTQLEIAAQPGVFATKNGVRNMRRWDTGSRAARRHPTCRSCPATTSTFCTMFDVDGLLVGYGGLAPEPLLELIAAGKARDYAAARAVHDRLLPVTKAVYHRGSHMGARSRSAPA
jgi:4-hydroxy-tetrahydrodipicolinate synthase